jgi:quinol monooxygenase YgiN
VTIFRVRVESEPSERRELLQAILAWGASARRERGVVEVRLFEDLEQSGTYCLSSEWRGPQALDEHLAGSDFGVLLGALEVLARRSQFDLARRDGGTGDGQAVVRRARLRSRSDSGSDERPDAAPNG